VTSGREPAHSALELSSRTPVAGPRSDGPDDFTNFPDRALWGEDSRLTVLMRALALLGVLLAQAKPGGNSNPGAGPWTAPLLDEKSYKKWSEFIRPSEPELKWKKIPWRTDLVAAAAEAKALNRPILLWSDQGNPLGLVDMAPSINTVISRQQVWSDDEIQKIAANFLPVVAEVWTLATGTSAASEWFHKAGGPTEGGRAHGLYCFTPDGKGLGFQFISRPKEPCLKLLQDALKKWNEEAVAKKLAPKPLPALKSKETWPDLAAKPGLLLVVHARDLPRGAVQHPGKTPEDQGMWNHLFLSLDEKEMVQLLPQGGPKSEVSAELLKKLFRRSFGDFAHGNNGGYRTPDAFKKLSLVAENVSVKEPLVTVRFTGEVSVEEGTEKYDAKTHGKQLAITGDHRIDQEGLYGFEGKLYGKAVYHEAAKKFVHFELVAAGTRKGLRDKDDYQPAPIGYAFTIEGQDDKAEKKGSKP